MISRVRIGLLGSVLVAATLAYTFLVGLRPQAGWVELEGPKRMVLPGRPAFLVRLKEPISQGVLSLDLRWSSLDGRGHGPIAAARTSLTHTSGREFLFEFQAGRPADLESVYAVIYVSTNGRWFDRSLEASTVRLPAELPSPGVLSAGTGLVPLPVYLPEAPKPPPVRPSAAVRGLTVLSFMLAAVAFGWVAVRLRTEGRGGGVGGQSAWVVAVLAAICGMAALVEAFDLGGATVQAARDFAVSRDVYLKREPVQRAVTIVMAGLGFGAGVWVVFRPMPSRLRLPMAACFVWFGLAGAAALSLRTVDRWDALLVPGYSALQVARCIASVVVLAGAVATVRYGFAWRREG